MAGDTVRKEWNDFKSFALKGNAFDLAVGVIIGAAFGRIVDGVVNLLVMPLIGALTGGLNFDSYFLPLSASVTSPVLAEAQKQGAVLAYGAFITVVINFLLVAFVLFQLVKISNRLKRDEPAPPPAPPSKSEELLAEIRDALKAKNPA
ncbi:large conductance mechanosensitive channel protein MscL [Aestuariivirga sp.]|uniref:large conductance mechanosensitive channel protein MscL n=1 Tax=Aestuariivirga sp. TaxID=2650926 RepID=UPI0025C617B0|nr:large conductance mechanosensitive channel protein MscL [Aestuariivirga sp.]MCA3555359.1 large conductance mechanosensitive channel protein MscL [Aestuariivirga sp.]